MAVKYSNQIIRFDGLNVFMEVLSSAFPIGKVQINFCSYDEKTHKQKNKLEIYLDMDRAMVLADDILSGRLDETIKNAKATKTFEGRPVSNYTSYFVDMGGIVFNRNGKLDEARFNKYKTSYDWIVKDKAISRQLKLQESTKYKYMLRAEYGLGNVNQTGLIVPEGNAKAYVQVPLTAENSYAFALAIKTHINAYWNQYYVKFGDKLFPSQKCVVFEPNKQN